MADTIFFFQGHLRKGPVKTFRKENGIVAETTRSSLLVNDCAFQCAFKELYTFVVAPGYDSLETSRPVGRIFQIGKKKSDVVVCASLQPGVHGRVNARRAA